MTIRIAFFGAGELAQPYISALGKRSDVELVGVCDADRRAAEQVGAGWNAQVFSHYDEMMTTASPDALWICVPTRMQTDVILQAAERAIPFFVEPPGAVDFSHARTYSRSVERNHIPTVVGFFGRFSDVVSEAREYLGTNPIPMSLGWWLCPPNEDMPSPTASGVLWHDGCRLVDGMRSFCGNVTRVRALSAGAGGESGGLVVQFEFDSGTVGMLTCASFARPAPRIELEMLGEGWSLNLGKDLTQLQLDEHDKSTILRCLNDPRADLVDAFLSAVVSREPSSVAPSYPDTLNTLAACEAARVSVKEGRTVPVDEVLAGMTTGTFTDESKPESGEEFEPGTQQREKTS
ncbi:MAG: Gfo/Idh/MocA family protein [Gemmataceae bacterium]